MNRFARWIASRYIPDWEHIRDPLVRSRYGVLEGWVSIVGNLVLAVAKFVLGAPLASAGLIADAVHSLSDMASSVVVIISFRVSRKPPDREHPFGHAKAEYIATLVVALMMIVAGVQIGQESFMSLLQPGEALLPLTWPVLAALVAMMLGKEALALFSKALGRMIESDALTADGWHHRTDALSTGIVVLGLAARNVEIYWLDGAAGLLVGLYIIWIGFRMAYDAVSPLLGETAPEGEIEQMRRVIESVPGVVSSHDLSVHKYGHFYFTAVHVELSDRLDVHRMHELSTIAETRILKHFPGECVVHVDPVNLHHPLLHRVADTLKDVVVAHPDLVEFRDLNLWSDAGREHGQVEVSVEPDTDRERYDTLSAHVQDEVMRRFPALDFQVHLKVDFTAEPLTG